MSQNRGSREPAVLLLVSVCAERPVKTSFEKRQKETVSQNRGSREPAVSLLVSVCVKRPARSSKRGAPRFKSGKAEKSRRISKKEPAPVFHSVRFLSYHSFSPAGSLIPRRGTGKFPPRSCPRNPFGFRLRGGRMPAAKCCATPRRIGRRKLFAYSAGRAFQLSRLTKRTIFTALPAGAKMQRFAARGAPRAQTAKTAAAGGNKPIRGN